MESILRQNKYKFINFKEFNTSQNTIYKDKKGMYHLYLHKIMIFKKIKLESNKDHIFTFCAFDAESKTELANNSLYLPKTGKLFWVSIWGLGTIDS